MNSSDRKKVMIYGVPIDLGSKPLGVEMGPAAIRYAGLKEAFHFNDIEYVDFGDLRIDRTVMKNGSVAEIAKISDELAALVAKAVEDGYIPIILGGDHSASIGSIAGVSSKFKRIGLLWLDCHPDANTPETSPSGNIHGMTVAISLGYGYPQLVQCAGISPKLLPEDVYIIGAKDIDKAETDFINQTGINIFTLLDIERHGIVSIVDEAINTLSKRCDAIHLSFDVDVLDPVIAPGTGILTRGGISYREIMYIMKLLGKKETVSSIDIIEINPLLDIKNQTSELAVELILTALGGSFGDYERNYLTGNNSIHGR